MWDIRVQILQITAEFRLEVHELPGEQRAQLLDAVFAKYTRGYRYSWAMWDTRFFAEHSSRQDEEGWRWCGDFVGDNEAVLFFNSPDEASMFVVAGGGTLVTLLGEMYSVEFYLTDATTDYLLCFNHHDYLIACGTARQWLDNYQPHKGNGH